MYRLPYTPRVPRVYLRCLGSKIEAVMGRSSTWHYCALTCVWKSLFMRHKTTLNILFWPARTTNCMLSRWSHSWLPRSRVGPLAMHGCTPGGGTPLDPLPESSPPPPEDVGPASHRANSRASSRRWPRRKVVRGRRSGSARIASGGCHAHAPAPASEGTSRSGPATRPSTWRAR